VLGKCGCIGCCDALAGMSDDAKDKILETVQGLTQVCHCLPMHTCEVMMPAGVCLQMYMYVL
jgi:hypothetical protein